MEAVFVLDDQALDPCGLQLVDLAVARKPRGLSPRGGDMLDQIELVGVDVEGTVHAEVFEPVGVGTQPEALVQDVGVIVVVADLVGIGSALDPGARGIVAVALSAVR